MDYKELTLASTQFVSNCKELEDNLKLIKSNYISNLKEDIRKSYSENEVVKDLERDFTDLSELYYFEVRNSVNGKYIVNTHDVVDHKEKDSLIKNNLVLNTVVMNSLVPMMVERDYIEICVYCGKLDISIYIEAFQ